MTYKFFSKIVALTALYSVLNTATTLAQEPCVKANTWTGHNQVGEPPTSAPASDCEFHRWAWNTFLWITQPTVTTVPDSPLRFEKFPGIAELYAPETETPEQVEKAAQLKAAEKYRVLFPRGKKSAELQAFDSVFQARTQSMLVDQDGRAVYYSQNVNETFFKFVRDNRYYLPSRFESARDSVAPAKGSAAFKYSWKILGPRADRSKFFWRRTKILGLKAQGADGKSDVVSDPANVMEADVALVGAHVVGVLESHPVAVWATFEHVESAPDISDPVRHSSGDVVHADDWIFYKGGTPARVSNAPNSAVLALETAKSQTLQPVTNVFRQYAWGGGDADNTKAIRSLNRSVREDVLAPGSVWRNYRLVGTTWAAPGSVTPNNAIIALGSKHLSNATMETFTQNTFRNCFACHRTRDEVRNGVFLPAKIMNVFHILKNGFFTMKKQANDQN